MAFDLHPDLTRDSLGLGHYALCEVRLMNDATYPWFILVPRRDNISDTIDLEPEDEAQMWRESRAFSTAIMAAFTGEKLNIAALGNMTPQLHVHHVVRYKADPAWPGPIWGKVPMRAYEASELAALRKTLLPHLGGSFTPL